MSESNFTKSIDFVDIEDTTFQPRLNLRSTSKLRNFGAGSLTRTVNEIYLDDVDKEQHGVVWQPDVYVSARKLADTLKVKRIIDIGCGNAIKLHEAFKDSAYKLHGVDYLGSLSLAIQNYGDTINFLESNLCLYSSVEDIFKNFDDDIPTLYIFSDCIEHLVDTRPLLRKLRHLLNKNDLNRCVVSTPDRYRFHGEAYDGLPPNQSHVREWCLEELVSYFFSCGFNISRQGYTRSNNYDTELKTCYLEISGRDYSEFLSLANLPQRQTSYCILTTEHADISKTGGIGSYVKEVEATSSSSPLIVFIDTLFPGGKSKIDKSKWVSPYRFFSDKALKKMYYDDWSSLGDIALQCLEQTLFYYNDIELVEVQEYLGLGIRVIQASKAGLLPSLVNKVVCHGSQYYLANTQQSFYSFSQIPVSYREKYSVENADIVVFPTAYLKQLYINAGYAIDENKSKVLRLPYSYNSPIEELFKAGELNTLCFLGKRTLMKGFPDFIDMLKLLRENNKLGKGKQINKLIVIGQKIKEPQEYQDFLDELSKEIVVEELHLLRQEVLEKLTEIRKNALLVLPYMADNHPVTVLEAMECKIPLIAYKTGGIPEIIPSSQKEYILSDNTAHGLEAKIVEILKKTPSQRAEIVNNTYREAVHTQYEINSDNNTFNATGYKEFKHTSKYGTNLEPKVEKDVLTIVVPAYNTPMNQIKDLCLGINRQSYLPKEVIFVNDGSQKGYDKELKRCASKVLKVPFQIFTQKNKGLAGARNTGFRNATTKYVIPIDSDDVPTSDSFYHLVRFLEINPDYAISTCYLTTFDENEDFEQLYSYRYQYHPSFQSTAFAILEDINTFGSAYACFRREVFEKEGGWDETDKSTFEDLAYYTRLTCLGYKVGIIPSVLYLYRVRKNSMMRTYNKHLGRLRVARNFVAFPAYDRFVYASILADHTRLQHKVWELESRMYTFNELEREFNSFAARSARGMRKRTENIPLLRDVMKVGLRFSLLTLKAARSLKPIKR